jgi:hypothetical protein
MNPEYWKLKSDYSQGFITFSDFIDRVEFEIRSLSDLVRSVDLLEQLISELIGLKALSSVERDSYLLLWEAKVKLFLGT